MAGTIDNIRKDCNRDQEAFYAYLDNMSTVVWYNYSIFKHHKFNKGDRISNQSGTLKYKTKVRENIWKKASLHVSYL